MCTAVCVHAHVRLKVLDSLTILLLPISVASYHVQVANTCCMLLTAALCLAYGWPWLCVLACQHYLLCVKPKHPRLCSWQVEYASHCQAGQTCMLMRLLGTTASKVTCVLQCQADSVSVINQKKPANCTFIKSTLIRGCFC